MIVGRAVRGWTVAAGRAYRARGDTRVNAIRRVEVTVGFQAGERTAANWAETGVRTVGVGRTIGAIFSDLAVEVAIAGAARRTVGRTRTAGRGCGRFGRPVMAC